MTWTETSWKSLPAGDKAPQTQGDGARCMQGHPACRKHSGFSLMCLSKKPPHASSRQERVATFPYGHRGKLNGEVINKGVGRVKGNPKWMMKLSRLTRMVATHVQRGRGSGMEMKERARNQAGAQPITWQGESRGNRYLHLSSPIFHSPAGSSSWRNLSTRGGLRMQSSASRSSGQDQEGRCLHPYELL